MAIPGSDSLEVPTIYKAYFSGLCKRISPQNMAKHMVLTYLHFRILEISHWLHVRSLLVTATKTWAAKGPRQHPDPTCSWCSSRSASIKQSRGRAALLRQKKTSSKWGTNLGRMVGYWIITMFGKNRWTIIHMYIYIYIYRFLDEYNVWN